MPAIQRPSRRPSEDSTLEAAARDVAEQMAIRDYGPGGFCWQIRRIGTTNEFECFLGHQPGRVGTVVGRSVRVKVVAVKPSKGQPGR